MNPSNASDPIGDATAASDPDTQRLIDWLVADAIRTGSLRATTPAEAARPFTPGLMARVVASVTPQLPHVVVKAGDNPKLVDQARHLAEIATDSRLPEFCRRAFPAVYSSTSAPSLTSWDGLHGYLMEDISTHQMLAAYLLGCAEPQQATIAADAVWAVLEPAYAATRTDARPAFERLYIEPARECLAAAARRDARLDRHHRIVLRRDNDDVELPSWEKVMDAAAQALAVCSSARRTFAHGDLVAWNILVPPIGDPGNVRLIDPVPGIDDLAHDLGRLIMSVRFMHAVDAEPPQLSVSGDVLTIGYDVPPQPSATRAAESIIVNRAVRFARSQGDHEIEARLKIATGVALLADLPQLASDEARRRHLAHGAFAEGLFELCAGIALLNPAGLRT